MPAPGAIESTAIDPVSVPVTAEPLMEGLPPKGSETEIPFVVVKKPRASKTTAPKPAPAKSAPAKSASTKMEPTVSEPAKRRRSKSTAS